MYLNIRLRVALCPALQGHIGALDDGHIIGALLVNNVRRDDHSQVAHLRLHRIKVDLAHVPGNKMIRFSYH